MAGLRIRWRRDSSRLDPPLEATAAQASGVIRLDVFVLPAIAVILAFALVLRLYNVDWDDGTHLHPDERFLTIVANDIRLPLSVGEYFDSDSSRLNPYNLPNVNSFVYGTFPLFLTKFVGAVSNLDNYDDLVLVGRVLSALFSAATVLLVFLIGRRLHGPVAGLIAAALFTFAPLAIQHAHFFVVDPFLTFFTTALLYFSLRIVDEGRPRDYGLAGLALGLGAACKITALVVTPVLLVAAVIWLWRWSEAGAKGSPDGANNLRGPMVGLAIAAAVAFLAFRIAQPYAFDSLITLDPHWLANQREQSMLLGGSAGFPPTVQWINRASYLYPLEEMFLLGMGPAFAIAGWGGFAYAAYRLARHRELLHLLPVVFVLVYFGFMGRQYSLYLRYFLPLYPVLALLAGYALVEAVRGLSALAERRPLPFGGLAYGGAGLLLLAAAMAGIAYFSIYTRPVTRVDASRWMYANLPGGASIAGEHWDDYVPFRLPGTPNKEFDGFELKLYELDTAKKVDELLTGLNRADYVVLSSNRLINSIPRNPRTYPVTTRYYELLFNGQLGFRLLREFTSYPGVLGIEYPDHAREESFSSYDHPRVLLFEKTREYTPSRARALLGQGPFATTPLTPSQAEHSSLLLSPADAKTQAEGGTWTDVFSDSGLVRSHPTLVWLIALEAAAFAVTPLALLLFRRLSDRGYLLAKPLGMLLLAYPVWLLVSLKLVPFERTTIIGVLIVLAALSGFALVRGRREIGAFLRSSWPLILFSEALFLVAFFAFRELRLENPDLWHPFRGGEKPMDLAFLTAVTRSSTLPPYDPWFSGGYINYYYLGQFFTATLLKLTRIAPEIGFNLAVPTFFALTVGCAFSICYNLAAAARGHLRRAASFRPLPGWSAYVAGILGLIFVALAGNFDALDQYVERLSAVSAWRLDTPLPLVDSVVNSLGGLWQVGFHGARLPEFDYWRSSRMLPPTISITEFPYFSFLFADLHAHMIAIAFDLLAIGAGLALILGAAGERRSWREWALVALLGLIVGSLRWINSWDYPTFLLLSLAALAISERRLEGGIAAALPRLAIKALFIVGLWLLFQPFIASFQAPVSGLHPAVEKTPLHQYLAHFGILGAVIGVWLLFLFVRSLRNAGFSRFQRAPEEWRPSQLAGVSLVALGGGALVLAMGLLSAKDETLVAALLPVFVLVLYLAARELISPRPDSGIRLFLLTLVGLGLGLSMAVDLVTVNGDIQRMNTVFKFYLHTWLAFAIVAAFAAWYFVFVLWLPAAASLRRWPRVAATAGSVGLVALLLAALLYPIAATPSRLDDRFLELPPTLDGAAYMRSATYTTKDVKMNLAYDYEGIEWLRENVGGTPVIVEGRTPLYNWGSRFSIYTGLPTVLGWDWHESQQRGTLSFMVNLRAQEVEKFYTDGDVGQALSFLRRYDVRYVIVGQVERIFYPSAGLAKFEAGLGGTLELAYRNPGLQIYRVQPAALTSTIAALP